MKIYFTGSISGLDKYGENYKAIVTELEAQGHKVLGDTTTVTKDYVYKEISDEEKIQYYKQVIKWMNLVDVVVCEASNPSLSIGHEVSLALDKNKPVVVLYSQGEAPHFLIGIKSEKLVVEKYNLENLKDILRSSIEYASDQQDTRFNFFISPKISNYLDWIAKEKRIPRAVFLRRLIEEDMEKSNEEKES